MSTDDTTAVSATEAPSVETVRELSKTYSNWGRWGADDQRGTLNHVTPERVAAAAASMPSTHDGDGVPMLMPTADAIRANSPDSCASWTMAGDAPTALRTFAAMSIDTKLVRYWTNGELSRTAAAIAAIVVDGVTGLLIQAP